MTVPSETTRSTYTGNGVTTAFSTGFYFQSADQVRVRTTPSGGVESIKVEGIDYTVTTPALGSGAAGSITFTSAPANLTAIVIERVVELKQETSFRTVGNFSPAVHEDQFDRLEFQIQQVKRDLDDTVLGSSSASIAAGSGLTSTGSGPVTLHVGAGSGVVVTADAVAVDFASAGSPAVVQSDAVAGAQGVATKASRSDHSHVVVTDVPGYVSIGDVRSQGTSTALARADHVHEFPAPAAPQDVSKSAASAGGSTVAAREDHKHDIVTAAAVTLTDATNAEGVAVSLARSDHTHSHGARGGGTLHAAATGAAAGFMSAADKAAFDVISASAARVRADANTAQAWVAGAAAAVVQFNQDNVAGLFFDRSANFDTTTYRFTAPRSGYYYIGFWLSASKSGGGNWVAGDAIQGALYRNGVFLAEGPDAVAWAALTNNLKFSQQVVVQLTAGDYIEVKCSCTGSNMATAKGQLHIAELP